MTEEKSVRTELLREIREQKVYKLKQQIQAITGLAGKISYKARIDNE